MLGRVKFYNEARGYGFLISDDGRDLFLHISEWLDKLNYPCVGDKVRFLQESGRDGKLRAVKIELIKD
jgi:CspA family cold shock protein